jgi:TM2 domain-containing membrane protein YozV
MMRRARSFANVYRTRRKDPQVILITALLGLIVVAGVHRFLLGQIGMGLLYLFTGGLCLIGTIIDLVNHQRLAFEFNQKVAQEVATIMN